MGTGSWIRVTKARSCPICGKHDWCGVSADGKVAHCMRIESNRPCGNGGWMHRLNGQDIPPQPRTPSPAVSKDPVELDKRLRPLALRMAEEGRQAVVELADRLGVSVESLRKIGAGAGRIGNSWSWTFPERNASGQIVGIARRFRDGKKGFLRGGKRGLVYADDWRRHARRIYIVEGPSDVAACLTIRVSAIGRPSNLGGCDDLAALLEPFKGQIVVISERDQRDHCDLSPEMQRQHRADCDGCPMCFPGWFGARDVSSRLSRKMHRLVRWAFPPEPFKDVRAFVKAGGTREEFLAYVNR